MAKMTRSGLSVLSPVSRILLSGIFLISGVSKILDWNQTAEFMASKGFPFVPLFLLGAILVEIVGGLSVLFGLKASWSGALLTLYLIPVTLLFHDFWNYQGLERQLQLANFLKNLAIMGGLLELARNGADAFSIDASTYHTSHSGHDDFSRRNHAA